MFARIATEAAFTESLNKCELHYKKGTNNATVYGSCLFWKQEKNYH